MRFVQFLLLTCAVGSASTLTNSAFGASDPNVIGNALYFDTQSISVSISATDQVTAVIDLDYDNGNATIASSGSNTYLGMFTESGVPGTLAIGVLFFYDPAAPTTKSCGNNSASSNCVTVPTANSLGYAVVLGNTPNLTIGDLYAINGTTVSTETAGSAYDQSATYRPGQVVEVTGTSGASAAATGSESVCKVGSSGCVPTANGAQYQITLEFTAPTAFLSLLMNGQIGVEFAAADCGNAMLAGSVTATPEPDTLRMIAAGIGMLGFGLARRRRKN